MAAPQVQDFFARITKAKEGHYYLYVTFKDGKYRTSSHLKISGAEKMFAKHSDFIYSPDLHHCGVRADVLNYLKSLKTITFDESQLNDYIKKSYCAGATPSIKTKLDAEIASCVSVGKTLSRDMVSNSFIIGLKSGLAEIKKAKAVVATPVPMTPKPVAPKESLKTLKGRIQDLPADKVLDLTSFDVEKKKGVKPVVRSPKGTKRPLGNTGDLSRIVFDFSKDKSIAVAALEHFGYSHEKATKIINDASKAATAPVDISKMIKTPKSPKKTA
jgi:hypothetical protein